MQRYLVFRCFASTLTQWVTRPAAARLGEQMQERVDITLVKRGNAPTRTLSDPPAPNVSPEMVTAAMDNGFSWVLNFVQFRTSPVAQLCEAFDAVFGYQASVNLYHTPAEEQAFLLHYDEEDVFVLQLAGAKRWTLHTVAVPFARADEGGLLTAALLDKQRDNLQPVQHLVLRPGDMLYIPRGTPHSAVNEASATAANGDGASTHLTVGLHVYLWQTFEGWLHRAATHWLSERCTDRAIKMELRKLDTWLPVGMFAQLEAQFEIHRQQYGREEATRRMHGHGFKAKRSAAAVAASGRGGAAAVLLHATLRVFANTKSSLRRAAVYANNPLHTEFELVVEKLCRARIPKARSIISAVRSWSDKEAAKKNSSDDGLGSLHEFVEGLRASQLGTLPASAADATTQRDNIVASAADTGWAERLPFSITTGTRHQDDGATGR